MPPASYIYTAIGSAMIGAGIGLIVGYKYAERTLNQKYDDQLKDELEQSRKFYTKMSKKEEYETPIEVVTNIIVEEGYGPPEEVEDTEEIEEKPIPTGPDPSLKPKKKVRTPPIVISLEDFVANPKDYDQRTITYYEGDDVLVDERGIPIEEFSDIIGLPALDHFGVRSKDPDIVYVRNDWLSMDFEVTREKSSYEDNVLGSIKHSDSRPRKFRIADE